MRKNRLNFVDSDERPYQPVKLRTWIGKHLYDESSYSVMSHVGQEKLIRDVSSPTTRNEKPYTRKHVMLSLPQGRLWIRDPYSYSTYYEALGLGAQTFIGGINTRMEFPYHDPDYKPLSMVQYGDWPLNPDLLSQAEIKAYASLRNKFKELDHSSYQEFGVFYGERRETAFLLRDAAQGLTKFVKAVRTLDVNAMARALRDLRYDLRRSQLIKRVKREFALARKRLGKQPGEAVLLPLGPQTVLAVNRAVLTCNLAVAPLLRALDDAYQGLLQSVADPSAFRIKGTGWVIRHDTRSESVELDGGAVVIKQDVNHLLKYTSVLIAKPINSDLAALERLGLANPVSLAAELTRATWLLNYFYPILDFLKATSTPLAFEFIDGSYSVKVSHLQNAKYTSSSPLGRATARADFRYVSYKRVPYHQFPVVIPPLSLRGSDLSAEQAVNTASFLLEQVRKAFGQ